MYCVPQVYIVKKIAISMAPYHLKEIIVCRPPLGLLFKYAE